MLWSYRTLTSMTYNINHFSTSFYEDIDMVSMSYIKEFPLGFIQAWHINWTNLPAGAFNPLTDLSIAQYLCLKSFFGLGVLKLKFKLGCLQKLHISFIRKINEI